MKTPRTRAEFERNFHLLHRQIVDGKFHVAEGISLDGLARLRFLPNKRIDFLSVDESARLQANMIAQYSEELFQELSKETAPPEQKSDSTSGKQRNEEST
jgi:hypothetical protein